MRVYFAAALALAACTGTVSLGTAPTSQAIGGADGATDSGADSGAGSSLAVGNDACAIGTTYLNDFESGFDGLQSSGGANLSALQFDTTNPIHGTTSLKVAPSGPQFAYLPFNQSSAVCRLTVSFAIRPSADFIISGARIVDISGAPHFFGLVVNPGGTFSIVQDDATTGPFGQLTANQVSNLSFTVDEIANTLSLTVDGHSVSVPLASPGAPNIVGATVGVTPPTPLASTPGAFWIDDLRVGTDAAEIADAGFPHADSIDSGADAGFAACGTATAFTETFENGFPTDVSYVDPADMSIDPTNAIDGAASLEVTTAGKSSYFSFAESSSPCALTLSFKVRPSAEFVAGSATLAQLDGPAQMLTLVSTAGRLDFDEVTNDGVGVHFRSTDPVGQLVANQSSTITIALDLAANTLSLTIDGKTTSYPGIGGSSLDPHLTSALIGTAPQIATGASGLTYWIDDVKLN